MIYHVLPGDAQVEDFRKTEIPGELIVFREALVTGPLDPIGPNEFWDARAKFILSEYGEDEIAYHEKVADEILRISDIEADDEVNLWFEFELFCSVNFWYCLNELKDSGARAFRVAPVNLEPDDVWKGFREHGSDDLAAAFESRTEVSQDDLEHGAKLWDAYRNRDGASLRQLADYRSSSMPFLKEVAEAASEIDSRPLQILREIRPEGFASLEEVFPEFKKRAGVYGFGDLQVERLLDSI
ncbi:MAG: DUF1835 domain-containing protein [Pyrinomonadaceae bacterium]